MLHTGTVMVRPEPVENGRDDFRGPEFRSRKSSALRNEFSRRRGGQSPLVDVMIQILQHFLIKEPILQLMTSTYKNPILVTLSNLATQETTRRHTHGLLMAKRCT